MAATVNCQEYLLDDLTAVTAIPVGDIPAGDLSSAVNSVSPTIAASGFSPSLANAVTVGREMLDLTVDGGTGNKSSRLVPIKRFTGKAKDDENDSVAGRIHTVTVTCEADDRNTGKDSHGMSVFDYLLALERTPSHLVLTFRDGQRAFVSATEDTYRCTTERDGAKTTVTFRIQNFMGIQLLV